MQKKMRVFFFFHGNQESVPGAPLYTTFMHFLLVSIFSKVDVISSFDLEESIFIYSLALI